MRGICVCMFGIFLSAVACVDTKENGEKKKTKQQSTESSVAKTHPGKLIYMQFCMACHMANGEGVPGIYPPLTQTEWVLGDKAKLIGTILHGQQGVIVVKGETYNNVMAKLDYLNDQQIADVLTYVRSNFGNNAEEISPAEVAAVRKNGLP
ncbi:MAG: cytochrome c [Cyclobacteriaceae bacterium]|nr:cytochrome c [Cyclobacteriaceae bacterium]